MMWKFFFFFHYYLNLGCIKEVLNNPSQNHEHLPAFLITLLPLLITVVDSRVNIPFFPLRI